MREHTDAKLFELVRASDQLAFDELLNRHWSALFTLAYKKLGDKDEVNDLLQDMFLEIWEKRESISFHNAADKWLSNRLWFKIAIYFRKKGFNQKHRESFSSFLQREAELVPAFDVLELRENQEHYEQVMNMIDTCIDNMPARMKEIYHLNKREGRTIAQISELLQISPKTVSKQLERASARLRELGSDKRISSLELLLLLWLINC